MKSISNAVIAALTAVLLAGCYRAHVPPSPAAQTDQPAPPRPPSTPESIPKVVAELQKTVEVERNLRVNTEARLVTQETAKSHWQSAAILGIAGGVVLLILGTILGTSARHDSEK